MLIKPEAGVEVIAFTVRGPRRATISSIQGTRIYWTYMAETIGGARGAFTVNWSISEWGTNMIPIPNGASEDQIQALMSIVQ